MANRLKMAQIELILALHRRGWSNRKIANELGTHRDTVARYLRLASDRAKQARALTGSDAVFAGDFEATGEPKQATPAGGAHDAKQATPAGGAHEPKQARAPTGSGASCDPGGGPDYGLLFPVPSALQEAELVAADGGPVTTSLRPQPSLCEPYRDFILAKLDLGLTAQRIFQDLVSEHAFAGKYHSVRRFVRRLGKNTALPFRRLECGPGDEAQVDFGTGAPIVQPDGRKRRTHVFRIVLSYSRKAYSEAVYRQTTEEFLRCLENAFQHFGGVPRVLVPDNLKAAVKQPDWFDPELNPKMRSFGEHYGIAIVPTRPATPRHKGKVEKGVGYVKDNGLKGHTFTSLDEENAHLLAWETTVADTRIHGTTRQQVSKMFDDERPALQPLPRERFPFFHEEQRIVHRDGHVEVAKAYYSVPPEYLGRRVWVRWDGRIVRIFNERMESIAVHVRREPGRFSTQDKHIASEKISRVERGAAWLLERVRRIGSHAGRWAENMMRTRGVEGVRVLHGLLSLADKQPWSSVERACEIADSHAAYHLRTVRNLIQRDAPKQLSFLDEHPLIRSLSEYEQLVHHSFQKGAST